MSTKEDLLKGKKILVVDDEPDIRDILAELLATSEVVKVGTFEEAKGQLETQPFDIAVLDIMGVDGYKLLEIAVAKNITSVMFTAHALSPADTIKSFMGGAAYYVPKDKMGEMPEILATILDAKQSGQSTWKSFMVWADVYYRTMFGPDFEKYRKEFQEKLK